MSARTYEFEPRQSRHLHIRRTIPSSPEQSAGQSLVKPLQEIKATPAIDGKRESRVNHQVVFSVISLEQQEVIESPVPEETLR